MLEINLITAIVAPFVLFQSTGGIICSSTLLIANNLARRWFQLQEAHYIDLIVLALFWIAAMALIGMVLKS